MEEITIKKVLDKDGNFAYVELHQGTNCVKLSFGNTGGDVQHYNYKWNNFKKIMEQIQTQVLKEVEVSLGSDLVAIVEEAKSKSEENHNEM